MTFSLAGSLKSCLLAAIGLSLAIETRTEISRLIAGAEWLERQVLVHLPQKKKI